MRQEETLIPEQSVILCCVICGETWTSPDAVNAIKAYDHFRPKPPGFPPRGPVCDTCWHILCLSRLAHAKRKSLRDVLVAYLIPMGKRTGRKAHDVLHAKKDR